MMNEINDIRTEESQYRKEMDAEKELGREEGELRLKIQIIISQFNKGLSVFQIASIIDDTPGFIADILSIASTLGTEDADKIMIKYRE